MPAGGADLKIAPAASMIMTSRIAHTNSIWTRSLLLGAGLLLASGPSRSLAQSQTKGPRPEFEVVSVKQSHLPPPTPMDAPSGPVWSTTDPGRFAYKNMWLRAILAYAYGMRPDEIKRARLARF